MNNNFIALALPVLIVLFFIAFILKSKTPDKALLRKGDYEQ